VLLTSSSVKLLIYAGEEKQRELPLKQVEALMTEAGAYVYDDGRDLFVPAWTHYQFDPPSRHFVRSLASPAGYRFLDQGKPAFVAGQIGLRARRYVGTNGELSLSLLLPDGPQKITGEAVGTITDPTGEYVFSKEKGDFDFTARAEIERRLEELRRANREKEALVAFEQKVVAFDAITRRVDALVKVPQSLGIASAPVFDASRTNINDNSLSVRGSGNALAIGQYAPAIRQSRRLFGAFGRNAAVNVNANTGTQNQPVIGNRPRR
jgi:hypothetical protein